MKFTIKYSFLFFLFANLCVTDLKAEWTKVAESTNGQLLCGYTKYQRRRRTRFFLGIDRL